MVTAAQFRRIAPNARGHIVAGVVEGLQEADAVARIGPPHRLAHFLAQLAHESAGYRTTREYADGSDYEGRRDLGNTRRGDGKRFRGRGLIQVTGRANARAFSRWCKEQGLPAPDFEITPIDLEAFPWALLSGAWYWSSRGLNRYADRNDAEMITRRINGGLNGYADRLNWYTRAALVLLGRPVGDVKAFQRSAGLVVDGIAGPRTRGALHRSLKEAA